MAETVEEPRDVPPETENLPPPDEPRNKLQELLDNLYIYTKNYEGLCKLKQDNNTVKKLTKIPLEPIFHERVFSYSCSSVPEIWQEGFRYYLYECPYKKKHFHVGRTMSVYQRQPTASSSITRFYESTVKPKVWININNNYDDWCETHLLELYKIIKMTYAACLNNTINNLSISHMRFTDSRNRSYIIIALLSLKSVLAAENLQYLTNHLGEAIEHIRVIIPNREDMKKSIEPVLISIPLFRKDEIFEANEFPPEVPNVVELIHPLVSPDFHYICLVKRKIHFYK